MRTLVEAPNGIKVSSRYLTAKIACKAGYFTPDTPPPPYEVRYLPNTPPIIPTSVIVDGNYLNGEGQPGGTPAQFTYLGTDGEVDIFMTPGDRLDAEHPDEHPFPPEIGPSDGSVFTRTYVNIPGGYAVNPELTFGAVAKTGSVLNQYELTLRIQELTRTLDSPNPIYEYKIRDNPDYDPEYPGDLPYALMRVTGPDEADWEVAAVVRVLDGGRSVIISNDVAALAPSAFGIPSPDERYFQTEFVAENRLDHSKAVAPQITMAYISPMNAVFTFAGYRGDQWSRTGVGASEGLAHILYAEARVFEGQPGVATGAAACGTGWRVAAESTATVLADGIVADILMKPLPMPEGEPYQLTPPVRWAYAINVMSSGEAGTPTTEELRQAVYLVFAEDAGGSFDQIQNDVQPYVQEPARATPALQFIPGKLNSDSPTIAVNSNQFGTSVTIYAKEDMSLAGLQVCIACWAITDIAPE